MYIPDSATEDLLFNVHSDHKALVELILAKKLNLGGDFAEIHWLNTPGPIYTTFTDNCGTGQMEALNNVSGDFDYREVIYKQPIDIIELNETMIAACIDPFGGYYFDGNFHWTANTILEWWDKSDARIDYVIDRFRDELELPPQPHVTSWKIVGEVFIGQLFGPPHPVPENYKYWLDFYQFGLKPI